MIEYTAWIRRCSCFSRRWQLSGNGLGRFWGDCGRKCDRGFAKGAFLFLGQSKWGRHRAIAALCLGSGLGWEETRLKGFFAAQNARGTRGVSGFGRVRREEIKFRGLFALERIMNCLISKNLRNTGLHLCPTRLAKSCRC